MSRRTRNLVIIHSFQYVEDQNAAFEVEVDIDRSYSIWEVHCI